MMQTIFIFPNMNPIVFSIGPLHVHWYGLMYLFGFVSAYFLALYRIKRYHLAWTTDNVDDLIFYAALGVIIGGRVGYMLIYKPMQWLADPFEVFKIWEGGMSFHGGLIGVMIALAFFSRRIKKPFWTVADFVVPLVPLGLAAGRAGNFINGELWGRLTNGSWGMIFPHVDAYPRHPSQLYELILEGFFLMALIWIYASKPRPRACVSAIFLMGYAACRFFVEYFRQPDAPLGLFYSLSMGQLLSIPMFIAGLFLYIFARYKNHAHVS